MYNDYIVTKCSGVSSKDKYKSNNPLNGISHAMRASGDDCAVGYPAHGIKILDLPRTIQLYIRHKKLRERQIYQALTKADRSQQSSRGSLTSRELVHALHGEIPEELFKNAFEPFMTESLWKLAGERKVGIEIVQGSRKWFLNKRAWAVEPVA